MAVCCQCNGKKARCSCYSCTLAGRPCTFCRAQFCCNRSLPSSQPSPVAPLATQSSSQASKWSSSAPAAGAGPSPSPLPSLASVCSTRVFTLPHIPKGALGRDLLSRAEGHLLLSLRPCEMVPSHHTLQVYPPQSNCLKSS